jgi:hypothetical protein
MNSININDIYDKVINNKIFVNLENNKYEQGKDLMICPKIKDESNYVFELMNSFKNNITNNNTNNSCYISRNNITNTDINNITNTDINNITNTNINNSFIYYLSIYIKCNLSDIKKNIEKHINDEDFECLKTKFNCYKKGINNIKKFLIEDNTDLEISEYLLYYISYLYNINIVITNNNIYKNFYYKNPIEILIFAKTNNQYRLAKNLTDKNNFENYLETNNMILYKSNSELNKLKINDIKNICKKMKIDSNNTKSSLIILINEEFNKF